MKKFSLFLSNEIQKALPDKNWPMAAVYRSAIDHLARLTTFGTCPVPVDKQAFPCWEGINKFLCGCHRESKDMKVAFAEAHRVEAYLYCTNPTHMVVEIKFYRLRQFDHCSEFMFAWDLAFRTPYLIQYIPAR